jgi:hypothetical protein
VTPNSNNLQKSFDEVKLIDLPKSDDKHTYLEKKPKIIFNQPLLNVHFNAHFGYFFTQ